MVAIDVLHRTDRDALETHSMKCTLRQQPISISVSLRARVVDAAGAGHESKAERQGRVHAVVTLHWVERCVAYPRHRFVPLRKIGTVTS